MRIENEHAGFIIRLHELFDDDAGKVAFARACAGDDGKMGTHQILDGEHNRHCLGGTRQQRADSCRSILSRALAAEDGGEHLIIGQENLLARLRRNPGLIKEPVACS